MAKVSLGTIVHSITLTREIWTLTPDWISPLRQLSEIAKRLPRVNSAYFNLYYCFSFLNDNN